LILGRFLFDMSAYKNIPLFDDFDTQDFLVWRELFLSYQDTHNPATAQLLRSDVFDDLGGLHLQSADVDPGDEEDGGDAVQAELSQEAVAAAVVGADASRKSANVAAKGHVILFLSPALRSQLLHLRGGVEVWADLHEQYAQWQDARGPALQRQYDLFKPCDQESVVAMCNRFDALGLQLSRVGMVPAPRATIQHFIKQLKTERPAWAGHLQGLWQVLPKPASLKRLRPGRVMQDSGLRQRLGQLEVDEADDLPPEAHEPPRAHAAVVPRLEQGVTERL
jgi:hypothetical protein